MDWNSVPGIAWGNWKNPRRPSEEPLPRPRLSNEKFPIKAYKTTTTPACLDYIIIIIIIIIIIATTTTTTTTSTTTAITTRIKQELLICR
jgi:hypothetical protein